MRYFTPSVLLALTSALAINALPTASSGLETRMDDLTARAAPSTKLQPFELEEEAAEAEEDADFLRKRDLEFGYSNPLDRRSPVPATAEELAAEVAEEIEDEEFLTKRDIELARRAVSSKAPLQPFELEEEKAEAEEDEDFLRKRDLEFGYSNPNEKRQAPSEHDLDYARELAAETEKRDVPSEHDLDYAKELAAESETA